MFLLPSKRFSLKLRPLYLSLIHSIFHAKCRNSALTLRKQKTMEKVIPETEKKTEKMMEKVISETENLHNI